MDETKTFYVVEEDGKVTAVFGSPEEAEEAGFEDAQPREMTEEEAAQLKQETAADEGEGEDEDEGETGWDLDDEDKPGGDEE